MSTHSHLWDTPSLPPVCVPITWEDVYRFPSPVTASQLTARLVDWLPAEWLAAHQSDVHALLWEHPDLLTLSPATAAAYLTGAFNLPRVDCFPVPPSLWEAMPVRSTL